MYIYTHIYIHTYTHIYIYICIYGVIYLSASSSAVSCWSLTSEAGAALGPSDLREGLEELGS